MKRIITLFSLLFFVCSAQSQMVYFKAVLQSAQQVPPNTSTAGGVVVVTYDTTSNVLTLWGNYKGLSTTINASHIHSPAAAGSNADVRFPLANTGDTTGTLSGVDTLTQADEANLMGGLMYVNVHSTMYPMGEIRGQLSMITSGQAAYFDGRLQGAQEAPPNSSPGMGSVHVLIDKSTDSVFLTGNFYGLTEPATMAHIHKNGLPGFSGPIFQNLIFSADTSGTLHVADTISAANITEMMNGLTYVNIHNSVHPAGAIRAQLGMSSETYYLKALLQGSQQVPPNASTAKGTVIVKYNSVTNILDLTGDYQNITDTITGSHIHSAALPGANADILFFLNNTGGTSGVLSGSDTLTDAQEDTLLSGMMYVNVHNNSFPDGEIRGQLTVTSGEGFYLRGDLQGAQQVPVNGSKGTGTVTVLLDRGTDSLYVTGNYSGLSDTVILGHVHRGQAGISGPVVVPLSVNFNTYGTVTGAGLVTPAFADSIVMGYSYVNIHTKTYPTGEIRAQLGNLVLPVKLVYFNGSKDGSNINLVWQTAQEVNLRSFEVEQQDASGNWIKKAKVAASGNSNGAKYQVKDIPVSGRNGVMLYRLKMIDADGTFAYSPVISIVFTGSKVVLSIVPNPVVNGVLLYTITGLTSDTKANVKIIDFSGKTMATATVSTLQNNRFYISNLPVGLYKLVVNINGSMMQKTFSKQ